MPEVDAAPEGGDVDPGLLRFGPRPRYEPSAVQRSSTVTSLAAPIWIVFALPLCLLWLAGLWLARGIARLVGA